MSTENNFPINHPFLESTYEGRPIIDRWGPSVLHIAVDTQHITWACLVDKGNGSTWRSLIWATDVDYVKERSIASIQANKNGVFVGRHPQGVPLVVIEDWTYQDDVSGVIWG